MHARWVTHVCVGRKGTLVRRMGRNSERREVRAARARRGSRRRIEEGRAERGFVGGEARMARAGCGALERRW